MVKNASPLRRRYLRELKNDPGKYLVIFLLLFLSIGFVSGFMVADLSMIHAYEEGFDKYVIEDGHFIVKEALTDAQREEIASFGVSIYDLPFINEEREDANGTIRVYMPRTQVNLLCLMKGVMAERADEIVLDRMYADNNHLACGDSITLAGKSFTITGLAAFPDYSCLFENNNDAMFDSVLFGTGVVTSEGYASLHTARERYCYAWLYDEEAGGSVPADTAGEREMAEALMKKTGSVVSLSDFVPRYANQAITFTGEDMGSDNAMMQTLLYIIIVILAFVFAVTASNTITRDACVIGTLKALGYTDRELIIHYMTLPVLVTLVSALAGNVLGYTVMKNVCVAMYYGSYSLPTYVTVWSAEAFLKTTLIPAAIMLAVNFVILRRALTLPPLKFLRRDLSRRKRKKALYLAPKIRFLSRFRIRVILQNLSGYLVLWLGIFFAYVLLLFGMMLPKVLTHFQDVIRDDMFCNYEYILQIPTETLALDNPLENLAAMIKLRTAVHTDNPDAEPFSVNVLKTTKRPGFREEQITLYGVRENSRYLDLPLTGDGVCISSAYAAKYDLDVGDTFTLQELYEDDTYDFTVTGIYPYEAAVCVYMPQASLNRMLGVSKDFFAGYFSDTPIEDIDERYIGTVIDEDALTRITRQLMVSMGEMMYLVDAFAVIIFIVLIYLISKMIIDRNTLPISMLKILGATDRETGRLYITPTTIVTMAGLVLTIPLVTLVIKWIFIVMLRSMMTGWLPLYMDRWVLLRIPLRSGLLFPHHAHRTKQGPQDPHG